jgi:NADP-dependent 3-hydroxy acid dehydrogenase YdfG
MNSISNVEGKVIVITGASSGLGESTARLLAEKGARVVLGAPCQDRVNRVVTDIKSAGGTALVSQPT